MARCRGTNKSGNQCKNSAIELSEYCSVHRNSVNGNRLLTTAVGVGAGFLLAPGLVGSLIGGAIGNILGIEDKKKTKVFVSFDFDNDRSLKDFIVGQSKLSGSPFEISDHSLKEAAPENNWEKKADRAIARSDMVVVLVGPKTYLASGVLKEVAMAKARNKKIVQIIGYKGKKYKPVSGAGRLYHWNWKNLENLLT